jgi:hypothetical protein
MRSPQVCSHDDSTTPSGSRQYPKLTLIRTDSPLLAAELPIGGWPPPKIIWSTDESGDSPDETSCAAALTGHCTSKTRPEPEAAGRFAVRRAAGAARPHPGDRQAARAPPTRRAGRRPGPIGPAGAPAHADGGRRQLAGHCITNCRMATHDGTKKRSADIGLIEHPTLSRRRHPLNSRFAFSIIGTGRRHRVPPPT